MLDHHIQRTIVYRLAFTPGARFSELKPAELENKLFTYHLKKVVAAGFVTKSSGGIYSLSPEGRRLSTGARDKSQNLIVERAHSVLFLVIRRAKDNAWLLYRRNTYPMLGFSGFMHCNPTVDQTTYEAAAKQCLEKTGLPGTFTPLGGGYFRVYKKEDKQLESFTHFTLLYCDAISGELNPSDDKAEYFWETDPDFNDESLFPATSLLRNLYEQKKPFFAEETFYI